MAIFQVTPLAGNAGAIGAALANAEPKLDFYKIAADSWLVSFHGTVKELCEIIGVGDVPRLDGAALVVRTNAFYGRADNDMWEWMASRLGS